MMLKSVLLAALAHLGLAAAAASSVPASTTQSGSPSPTIQMFFAGTARPTEGGPVSLLVDASVVEVKAPLTTVAVCINYISRHQCEESMRQTFTLGGTTLLEYNEINTEGSAPGTIRGACTIKEAATCSVSLSTSIGSFSTNIVETTTYAASEVTFVPVTITAGAEKLSSATNQPSSTGKPNSGPKATGMPNLALLGGAAAVGAALVL
ncbi:hypothetical protein MGYG_05413 [Nannizzia gypsea CBS 118893]|uniref:GPI anchored cell wall protein n=1 Tax=Arthroderma gypseum (strain ATCC MYA-4604 / CBS 118893) TaxID=535722 RepID=E4UVU0_ARTGP|nr:hypothetical protein MGYG_05413 [Nannizzia gypsea CBS 118893]EFR02417.1 hypothetical protein MGYG_05413 [Nannizzia gypsea CBS 118893]